MNVLIKNNQVKLKPVCIENMLFKMGIKHLHRFIHRHASSFHRTIPFIELRGKKIAVDTSIYMYKYLSKNALFDEFYLMIQLMLNADITPIFIFDGKPHHHKNKTMQHRRENKTKKEAQLQKVPVSNIKERKRLQKQCIRVTQEHTNMIKELMDTMGVMYLDAPYEADELCAKFVLDKKVYACLSDDMDMFVYGCSKILRMLDLFEENVVLYDMSRILRSLKMNQSQFRDMCVLSGTDYNDGTHTIDYYYKQFQMYKKEKTTKPLYEWLLQNGKANKPFWFAKIYFHFDLHSANYKELKVFEKIILDKKGQQTSRLNEL